MEWVDKHCGECKYKIKSECRYIIHLQWDNFTLAKYARVDSRTKACSKWSQK